MVIEKFFMSKVLCTGNAGFLGTHILMALYLAGFETVGVDKRPIGPSKNLPDFFIQTDINDLTFKDLMGIDYVIHLAWRTNIPDCQRHPEESTQDNINTTVHLIEICKEAGVKKFIFPSTASLYGHNPTPWTEDMPPSPIEPYSWQKLACEHLCKMNAPELPSVVLRFFQIFGEHQREDTALAAFLRMKREKVPITLTETMAQSKFKSGQRDFIYAGDIANAVICAMQSNYDKGEILNVASGTVRTMEEIAKALEAEVKWIPKREYEVERHEADISKLTALGWSPKQDVITWLQRQ